VPTGPGATDSAYTLFNSTYTSSPLHKWRNLYIDAINENLPRLQNFGPLFGSAYFGLQPIVEQALRIEADIEAQDDERKTPLHWAAERGYTDIVTKLLYRGFRIDFTTYSSWTALHFAAKQENKLIVLLLLNTSVSVTVTARSSS
jgi:ankyrin repeat protein